MITEELKALVAYRMEQAQNAVGAAKHLAAGGFTQECVSRSYYAMFYAVLALLATKVRPSCRFWTKSSRWSQKSESEVVAFCDHLGRP